jgi:hypothetical protein
MALLRRLDADVADTNGPAPVTPVRPLSPGSVPCQKLSLRTQCAWSIELLVKDEKQNLGLGANRVLRYRAVVRHLHLVDCAYACLTHVGLEAQRAQGRKDAKNVLRLPPIRQLKQELRQMVWNEAIQSVESQS